MLHIELLSFEMDVTNIVQAKTYKLTEDESQHNKEMVGLIRFQMIQTLTGLEKEAYRTAERLFSTLD